MIHNPFDISVFNFTLSQSNTPGSGNNLVVPVAANTRSELVCISFVFTADANAADRYIHVFVTHDSRIVKLGCSGYKMTANMVRNIIIGQHGCTSEVDNGNNQMISIPSFPFLLSGDVININIIDKQAGDTISVSYWLQKVWIYEQQFSVRWFKRKRTVYSWDDCYTPKVETLPDSTPQALPTLIIPDNYYGILEHIHFKFFAVTAIRNTVVWLELHRSGSRILFWSGDQSVNAGWNTYCFSCFGAKTDNQRFAYGESHNMPSNIHLLTGDRLEIHAGELKVGDLVTDIHFTLKVYYLY